MINLIFEKKYKYPSLAAFERHTIMARTKRTKRFRKRGKWSANIETLANVQNSAAVGEFANTATLCTNPIQTNTTVSQQFTVKNIEAYFNFDAAEQANAHNLECLTAYIMFVPQGMNIGSNYEKQHPEYIMAMRYYGSPEFEVSTGTSTNGIRNPLRIKTRLARRLQTGDSIVLYIKGINQSTSDLNYRLGGVIRWWTKAN